MSERLDVVCKHLFSKGNSWFIIAEAYEDGFIREGRHFHYQYFQEDSLITTDEKPIPEPYQSRYKALLVSFKKAHPEAGPTIIGSMRCGGIFLDKLLNEDPHYGPLSRRITICR